MLIANRYKVQKEIGQGGMGVVYQAYDRLTQQIVALKRVNTDPSNLVFNSKTDDDMLMALAREFRILASLRHPNIIPVLDYGFDAEQRPFFTMELLDAPQDFFEVAQVATLEEQVNLFVQMLQALSYLHQHGIIHRDLKPANVLVQNNQVYVLDFGLSVVAEVATGRAGTVAYMSPEIVRHSKATQQSDLFAVGVMLYKLIVGELPYDMSQILGIEPFVASSDTLTGHPLELVILRLISENPQDRYSSAQATIQALCDAIGTALPIENQVIRESFLQAAPFIGRDLELGQLIAASDAVLKGNGSSWLIGGESGIGKSRLLDEVRTHALVTGIAVFRGQGVEGGGLPYQLWRDMLRHLILSTELSELEKQILKEIVPDIGMLLGENITDAPQLDGKTNRERLTLTIVDIFKRQKQPTLVILEDLQWTIESLEPLKHLNRFVHDLPLVIMGNYRNDEKPDLPENLNNMEVITLSRLDETTIAELSTSMLGETGTQPQVLDLLKRETEGNVFFMVEVVRALAEEAGSLGDIGQLTLPGSVFTSGMHHVLRRRIDQLPADAHHLLQLAAVAGRQVNESLLHQMVSEMSVEQWLYQCSSVAVLTVQDNRWQFAHDKLRELLVNDLSDEECPDLHRQVAEAIETVYPNDDHYAYILANHWQVAGDHEKEAFYAFRAAEHLNQLGLNQGQALAIRGLNLQPNDTLLWAEVSLLVARNYWDQGEYQKSREHYQATLMHARQHDLVTEELAALNGLGQITYITKNLFAALEIYEDAIALATKVDDKPMLARLLKNQSVVLRFIGDHKAAYHAATASLEIIRTLDVPRELARILYAISVISRNEGNYDEASNYLEEGIGILRELNAISNLGHSLNNLGICYMLMGHYDKALENLEEGKACRAQVGHDRGVTSSKSAIGDLYSFTGRYSEAQSMYQEALDFWQPIGDLWNIANSHADVGFPLLIQGEVESATQHWQDALRGAHELRAGFVIVKAIIGIAWLAEYMGDEQRALQLLSLAQAHESSTQPLYQTWIQPLLGKMDIEVLPSTDELDLQATIDQLLQMPPV